MKTWLRAMGGKPPNAIIIDHNRAWKTIIAEVFPNAKHHFCLWHILRKVPEKLSHMLRKHEDFMTYLYNFPYKSWLKQQFKDKWKKMIENFQLLEDEWIQSLYGKREHWILVYLKDTSFGCIYTTQISKSINSFFDKYVNKKTTLKEFVEKYKLVLQDREDTKMLVDFNTQHKKPVLKTPSPFEKQMTRIYMHEVFEKFQIEVLGLSECHLTKENEDGQITSF